MEDPNEPTSQVDRGILAFLGTLTQLGLVAFFIVLILGFANMLANNIV
tara:strand:- start:342 stop:485 length:144 start_codon:yes stop_codon:yes gene_type:complete